MAQASEEAIRKATGNGWNYWYVILDKAGAKNWTHKETAKWLWDNYGDEPATKAKPLTGWWCQMVTVGYEYHHGKRVVGETVGAGFEIGVQKVFPAAIERVWGLLTTPPGIEIWLGDDPDIKFESGYKYQTKEGVTGELRRVYENQKMRLTYQPPGYNKPTTLQIYLECPRNNPNKTTVTFHQEKLASSGEREKMRKHWKTVVSKLERLI